MRIKNIESNIGQGKLSYNKELFGKSPKEILLLEINTATFEVGDMCYELSYDTLAFSPEESFENDCYFEVIGSKSGEFVTSSHPFYEKIEDEDRLIKIFESGVIYNTTDEDDY